MHGDKLGRGKKIENQSHLFSWSSVNNWYYASLLFILFIISILEIIAFSRHAIQNTNQYKKKYSCQYFASPSGNNKNSEFLKLFFHYSINKTLSFQQLPLLAFFVTTLNDFWDCNSYIPRFNKISQILITFNSLSCRSHIFFTFCFMVWRFHCIPDYRNANSLQIGSFFFLFFFLNIL